MTRPARPTRLCTGLALLAVAAAVAARADDASPESVLKDKGLKKAGTSYVLPAEAEVQKKLNAARSLYQKVGQITMQKEAIEEGHDEAQAQLMEMEQQRVFLNQQYTQAGSVEDRNLIVAQINALNGQMKLLQNQNGAGGGEKPQYPGAKLAMYREEFMEAVLDLRTVIDKAKKDYAALAADESVKAALAALNGKSKAKSTLGPSRTFLSNEATLATVEANVLTEDVELRTEGGVHWLDVTFNGKTTRPMVFDTGASSVVLPADLAEEIGLKPGPKDEKVKARVADGSEVEARRTTIPSVRVGKFTVKNVEAIVMPADKKDVPPLLGQSFHKFFTYKFSADAGRLVLAQVETPQAKAKAAAEKSKTKAGTKARGKRSSKTAKGTADDGN